LAEVHAEGVDPEVVEPLGVAGGDVAGDAFVEAHLGEEAKAGGEALLAVQALLLDRVEGGRHRDDELRGLALGDVGHGTSSPETPGLTGVYARPGGTLAFGRTPAATAGVGVLPPRCASAHGQITRLSWR